MNVAGIAKVVKDPELRFSQGGKAWLVARVGIESRVKNGDSYETRLTWANLKAFGNAAENAAERIAKGSRLVVIGKLVNADWTNDKGETVEDLDLLADEIGECLRFLPDPVGNGGPRPKAQRPAAAPSYSEEPF
jgi:single-strand DNA-binding protein